MGYSAWAKRRKTFFTVSFFLFLLAIIVPILLVVTYEKPSCFDGKQNQGETAPDMGGPCERLDPRFLEPVKFLWGRPLKLKDGYYNAVVYVQNNNQNAGAKSVPYRMTFYDSKAVIVATREGVTDIYPGMIIPIFEGGVYTGKRKAVRLSFRWLQDPVWIRRDKAPMNGLKIYNQSLSYTRRSTRLSAKVKNTSIDDKADIYFIATLFDKNGTAIASSRTYLPYLKSDEVQDLVFTWPSIISPKPASVDIIPIMPLE